MQICIVMENFRAGGGGNENSTQQIIRRLLDRDQEVILLANRIEGDTSAISEAKLIAANGAATSKAPGFIKFTGWAEKKLHGIQPAISLSMTTAVAADLIQPRSGTIRETLNRNIMMRPEGGWRQFKKFVVATSPKQNVLLRAERSVMASPYIKQFIPNSDYGTDQLMHHYEVAPDKITMIPNAVDPCAISQDERNQLRTTQREQRQLKEDDFVFAFIAMNPRLKGAYTLVQAFDEIADKNPQAKLLMAGQLDERLEQILKTLKHPQAIQFLGKLSDPEGLYAMADCVVLPSFYDPASKVILEAIIRGIPCISTVHNGASRWILDPTGQRMLPSPLHPSYHREILGEAKAGIILEDALALAPMREAIQNMLTPEFYRGYQQELRLSEIDPQLCMDAHVDRLFTLMKQYAL